MFFDERRVYIQGTGVVYVFMMMFAVFIIIILFSRRAINWAVAALAAAVAAVAAAGLGGAGGPRCMQRHSAVPHATVCTPRRCLCISSYTRGPPLR